MLHLMNPIKLITNTLQNTGRKPCLEKAESLLNSASISSLNLRSLALQREEALQLAIVFNEIKKENNEALRSVSFSYNDQMTNEGAVALINSLPESVTELGMVSCGLTDEAGKAILNWLKRSRNLNMVCIEGNHFSSELRDLMREYQHENSSFTFIF